jgi:hypothetical protein
MSAHEGLRCHRCRDPIGAYEPVVVLREGAPVRTSRTALDSEALAGEPCFHAECFACSERDAEAGSR